MTEFSPKDAGAYITNDEGKTIKKIVYVKAEPEMQVVDMASDNSQLGPISAFKEYRRLLLEPRPTGRPPGSKRKSKTEPIRNETTTPGGLHIIQSTETTPAKITFGDQAGEGAVLKTAAINLMLNLNLPIDKSESWPFDEDDKKLMVSMLGLQE